MHVLHSYCLHGKDLSIEVNAANMAMQLRMVLVLPSDHGPPTETCKILLLLPATGDTSTPQV